MIPEETLSDVLQTRRHQQLNNRSDYQQYLSDNYIFLIFYFSITQHRVYYLKILTVKE